jgi:catechol 2,3-dioxygenase-like lactoylglutathione lyase family enzyme
MPFKGVNLAFVYVRDMDAARRFYEDLLGLPAPAINTPKWVEYSWPGGRGHFALHRGDPARMDVAQGAVRAVVCLEVDDFAERFARLKAAGVPVALEAQDTKWYWLGGFTDPDGNEIRLQQYK